MDNDPERPLLRTALFLDFDNVYLGLRELSMDAATSFATDPLSWIRWLERAQPGNPGGEPSATPVRRIIVRQCYWNPRSFDSYRADFTYAAFSITDCPALTKGAVGLTRPKTATDIHLVIGILDMLGHATRFDEFILMSGDADFTPVLHRLRSHDRRLTVIAAENASRAYTSAADDVISLDDFIQGALGGRRQLEAVDATAPQAPAAGARGDLLDRMAEAVADAATSSGGELSASDLPNIFKRFPEFTPSANWLGFFGLRPLMRAIAGHNPQLRLVDVGPTWCVRLVGPSTAAEAEAAPNARPPAAGESPAGAAAGADTRPGTVIARVRTLVQDASAPLTLAQVAQVLVAEFGPTLLTSRWLRSGTLKNLLTSVGPAERGFEVASSPPGYVFDPQRHRAPHAPDPLDVLRERWPDLMAVAGRVSRLTGVPILTPAAFATLFEVLDAELSANPFDVLTTATTVRERCIERDTPIERSDVLFVLRLIVITIPDLAVRPDHSARMLSSAFLEGVLQRCDAVDLKLTDDDHQQLATWIQGELPTA